MQASRTHTLYLSSKQRNSGTTSRYSVIIPQPIIEGDADTEIVKISLVDFTCYYNWYLANTGFNTITFTNLETNTDTVVALPEGTYRFQKLAREIAARYNLCTVAWDEPTNKLVFAFQTPHSMTFDGIYEILGFSQGANPQGTVITSEFPMRAMPLTDIYAHLTNITPVHNSVNLDNLNGGDVRPSNILARIPINTPPFQVICYKNDHVDDTGIDTHESSLNRLEFLFTNTDGVELTYLPEHEMTLRISVHKVVDEERRDVVDNISEIRDTLKDLFLLKHLRQR